MIFLPNTTTLLRPGPFCQPFTSCFHKNEATTKDDHLHFLIFFFFFWGVGGGVGGGGFTRGSTVHEVFVKKIYQEDIDTSTQFINVYPELYTKHSHDKCLSHIQKESSHGTSVASQTGPSQMGQSVIIRYRIYHKPAKETAVWIFERNCKQPVC